MMRITTIDEARAIVGRTFERDGWKLRVDDARERCGTVELYVASVMRWWWDIASVSDWLSGATEIVTQ